MSRLAQSKSGRARALRDAGVGHRSTKPRAGGSNPSGRTNPSRKTRRSTYIARAVALGVDPHHAARLYANLARIARAVVRGSVAPHDGQARVRAAALAAFVDSGESRQFRKLAVAA